jgi:hypothetical protein
VLQATEDAAGHVGVREGRAVLGLGIAGLDNRLDGMNGVGEEGLAGVFEAAAEGALNFRFPISDFRFQSAFGRVGLIKS